MFLNILKANYVDIFFFCFIFDLYTCNCINNYILNIKPWLEKIKNNTFIIPIYLIRIILSFILYGEYSTKNNYFGFIFEF